MGFWSTLANIGGAVAAPFTGGLSLAAGPLVSALTSDGSPQPPGSPSTASAIGQTAGSIESQRLKALIEQARLQQEQDQLGLNRTNAGVNVGNLDLAQKKQALAAPGMEAGNSVRGDVLANSQDANFTGLPSYIHIGQTSGGLRPSMLSASSRALGSKMSRDALLRSMSGADTTFAPLPSVPSATPLPEANAFDKILQGGAVGGSFLNALKGVIPGNTPGASASPDSFAGPRQETDPNAFTGPTDQIDTSNLNADGSGIDPAILEMLRQQAQPVNANG